MLAVYAGDFEDAIIQHDDTQRSKRNARRDLYLVHVVDFEVTGLFDPIFEKGSRRACSASDSDSRPLLQLDSIRALCGVI